MSDCLHPFWNPSTCEDCGGSGKDERFDQNTVTYKLSKCPECKGTGRKKGYETCDTCGLITVATFETDNGLR